MANKHGNDSFMMSKEKKVINRDKPMTKASSPCYFKGLPHDESTKYLVGSVPILQDIT